jgi:hypothetical protein
MPVTSHTRKLTPWAVALIRSCGACGANEEAAEALEDEDYHARLTRYGKDVAELTDPIWRERYLRNES